MDTIVLSGVYKSTPGPDSDFGYEVVDFMNVDDRVGTLDDVRSLVTAAHDKGSYRYMHTQARTDLQRISYLEKVDLSPRLPFFYYTL